MGIYSASLYGLDVYGEGSQENIFWEWLPRVHKRLDENGQLERFCLIFSHTFWQRKADIEGQLDLFDVDRCPAEYLPHLAFLIGVDYNYDLEEDKAREEIKAAVPFYKVKGTQDGVKFFINSITGWSAEFISQAPFILRTNTVDNYTPNVNNATPVGPAPTDPKLPLPSVYGPFLGGPDDLMRYTVGWVGEKYGFTSYWVQLEAPDDTLNPGAKLNKLSRIKDNLIPINTAITDFLLDTYYEEVFDHIGEVSYTYSDNMTELNDDTYSHEGGEYNDTVVGMNFIFTNTATTFTNTALNWTAHPWLSQGTYGFLPA